MPQPPHDDHDHAPDGGFRMDMARLLTRRGALGLAGLISLGAGATLALRALPGAAQTATAADGSVCIGYAAETAGPFPADGTNARAGQTVNALAQQGVLREDITRSFAGMEGLAEGVPLDLTITLVDVSGNCAPLAGHAVYLWHCDALGNYSLYSIPEVNYLRGLGVTDAQGRVCFRTIFPGCYDGRWPHMHFEVFTSPDAAVTGSNAVLTSQFALPADASAAIYAADARYGTSAAKLARLSLGTDMIFRDNTADQVAAQTINLSGNPLSALTGTVTVGIAI
jgi:protocatechuate 3,4-dioxygenase beta subunit